MFCFRSESYLQLNPITKNVAGQEEKGGAWLIPASNEPGISSIEIRKKPAIRERLNTI